MIISTGCFCLCKMGMNEERTFLGVPYRSRQLKVVIPKDTEDGDLSVSHFACFCYMF